MRLRPRGHPAVPGPGRSETRLRPGAPPSLGWIVLLSEARVLSRQAQGSSGKASVREGGFVFGDRLLFLG